MEYQQSFPRVLVQDRAEVSFLRVMQFIAEANLSYLSDWGRMKLVGRFIVIPMNGIESWTLVSSGHDFFLLTGR